MKKKLHFITVGVEIDSDTHYFCDRWHPIVEPLGDLNMILKGTPFRACLLSIIDDNGGLMGITDPGREPLSGTQVDEVLRELDYGF